MRSINDRLGALCENANVFAGQTFAPMNSMWLEDVLDLATWDAEKLAQDEAEEELRRMRAEAAGQ